MIHVYEPWIAANQNKYVLDALEHNELSFRGKYEGMFSKALCEHLKVKHCILTTSGTTALYAAYRQVFKDNPKQFIVTPTITFATAISQIKLLGFTPLYIDCDENFQMDLGQLKKVISAGNVSGVVATSLYADSCDMNEMLDICGDIPIIEDAAEAFSCWNYRDLVTQDDWGAHYADCSRLSNYKAIGTYGKAGCFSFFANKVITTAEGGAIVTNDDELATSLNKFHNCNTVGGYKHDGLGTNFRMTALQGAIGLAQLEDLLEIVNRKRNIAKFYRDNLKFEAIVPKVDLSSEWMPIFKLQNNSYPKFRDYCTEKGIEVRPTFYPVHQMPEYEGYIPYSLTNSLNSVDRYFILPSYPALNHLQLEYIVDMVNKYEE